MPTSSRGMPEKLAATPWTMDKRAEPTAPIGAAVQQQQQQQQPNAASLVGALLRSPPPAHSGYGPSASGHLVYGSAQLPAVHPATMIANIPPGMFGVATSSHLGDQKTKISRLTASSDGPLAHAGGAGRTADTTAQKARHSVPEGVAGRVSVNGDSLRRPVGSGSREPHPNASVTTPPVPAAGTVLSSAATRLTKGSVPAAQSRLAATSAVHPATIATKSAAGAGKGVFEASMLAAVPALHVPQGKDTRTQAPSFEQARSPVTMAVAAHTAVHSAALASHASPAGSRSGSPAAVAAAAAAVGRAPSPAAATAAYGRSVVSTAAASSVPPSLQQRRDGSTAATSSRTDPPRPGSTFKIAAAAAAVVAGAPAATMPHALARDSGFAVSTTGAVSAIPSVLGEASGASLTPAWRAGGSGGFGVTDPVLFARSAKRPASAGPQSTVVHGPFRPRPSAGLAATTTAALGAQHVLEVSGLHRPLSPLVTGGVIVRPHPSGLVATAAAVPAAGASPRPADARLSNGGVAPVDYSSRASVCRPTSNCSGSGSSSSTASSLQMASTNPLVAGSVPNLARPVSAPAAVVVSAARPVFDRRQAERTTGNAASCALPLLALHSGRPNSYSSSGDALQEAKNTMPGTASRSSPPALDLPFAQFGKPAISTEQGVPSPHVARGGALVLPHSTTTATVTSATVTNMVSLQPFNQRLKTLANFPLSTSQLTSASRMRLLATQRSRAGCVVSSAKSLELLRRTVQKLFNAEVDALVRKRIAPFLRPAFDNMCTNSAAEAGGPAAALASFEQSLASVCCQLLEEAKKMFAPAIANHARSTTPDGSDCDASDAGSTAGAAAAEKRAPRLMFSHLKRRYSDSDSEASAAATIKKRRGRPPGSGSANAAARLLRLTDPVRRDAAKWNPDRIKPDQLFIMGARANKALGLGATRGRLYIKHPEVFKYTGDQDDKLWLFDAHLLPATGGKAYMLLVEDVRELAEKDEYKNSGSLMLHELKGFAIPDWMQVKVKAQMMALGAEGSRRWPAHAGMLSADVASVSSSGAGEDSTPVHAAGGTESSKATPSSLGESPYPTDHVADEDDKEEHGLPFFTSGDVSGSSETEEEEEVTKGDDDDDEPPPLSAPFTMTEPAGAISEHH